MNIGIDVHAVVGVKTETHKNAGVCVRHIYVLTEDGKVDIILFAENEKSLTIGKAKEVKVK